MTKYLATFSDIHDSVEVNGFIVMTDTEFERFEELAQSITWEFWFPLGDSDAELTFTSGDDLLSKIDFREIADAEYKILKKVFNNEYGIFVSEEFLNKIVDDDEEEDIEDEYDDLLDEEN